MKIGINDGCANGGMMDSMSIEPMAEEPGWKPYSVVEVTDKEWADWQAHLEEHNKWEHFWTKHLLSKGKSK